jgi:chromosome segregation ATPase
MSAQTIKGCAVKAVSALLGRMAKQRYGKATATSRAGIHSKPKPGISTPTQPKGVSNMSTNLSVEEILAQIPGAPQAIAEYEKKRWEATAKERGELIEQARAAEARLAELEKELSSARAEVKRAYESIGPLERRVWAAQQAYSDCRGSWTAHMDSLAKKYGNSEIDIALVKLGAWRASVETMAKNGIGSIEGNSQRREHAIEVQKELESLVYANGHPEEIKQKITEAMSLIAMDGFK